MTTSLSTIDVSDIDDEKTTAIATSSTSFTDQVYESKKTLLGMIVVAIGTALFCTVGAIVQYHGGSVLQLMLGRYVTQNLLAWLLWFSNPCKITAGCQHWYGDAPHRLNIWTRGFLLFCVVFFWWRGLELMPLGDGEAILFLSPIITVIAARILLAEALPSTFILTLVITLAGLVCICQPSFIFGGHGHHGEYIALSWQGIVFMCACTCAWSACCILVRSAKKAHWLQLEICASLQSMAIWCPLVILLNRFWLQSDALSGGDWDFSLKTGIVMMLIGVLGFVALMFNVVGYQIGDATKVAWMEYLDLVFAFLYQWLYFKDVPTMWEIIGCCALLSTCLIHLAEEYYHYVRAKNDKESQEKVEKERIGKEKEGGKNHPVVHEQEMNEMQPLLAAEQKQSHMNGAIDTVLGKIQVFESADYVAVGE
eukprot:CAMPEP_0197036030 /NCGR_PEP_ID=MMETSP1384-20130603/13652_1 /TAXON_ID=29189 /ORGANISM="Ammonia sp." /LENGTH=423 /DNA_ID=CAMNT_0042466157 /DNA_START=145 /DNA_END=1416 /DNA_ORIENTATION=-